jgi:hypothetical protein
MPTVRELSALYETFMVSPRPGPGICSTCLTFTESAGATAGRPYPQCYPCATTPPWLDAVAPISYSVAGEQLHHALVSYKRLPGRIAAQIRTELAAVLWRYLEAHEPCIANQLGIGRFSLITTVPSGRHDPGHEHPLSQIVGELCELTRDRYEPVLGPSADSNAGEHEFDAHRFEPASPLSHQPVLLIDDTWTTGASAQSAAAALKRGGASHVALVVIGRHLKRDWRENGARLDHLRHGFDWDTCLHCAQPASLASAPGWRHQ